MLLKAFLIASSLLLLMGCATKRPIKPSVVMCVIDAPAREGICSSTHTSETIFRAPINSLDKNVCFSPDDWYYIQNYIHYLESVCPQ